MQVIRNSETGEITTSVDFETIKEQLIEEYTDMIEVIGIVEFIVTHEKAIAEAKGEELNEKDLKEAIVTNTVYPLILNLPECEKPLFMKIKYHKYIKEEDLKDMGNWRTIHDNQDIPTEWKITYKFYFMFDSITIEEIGGK